MFKEASITINGNPLTVAQAMTVRVSLAQFMIDIQEPGALGDDENGQAIREGYLTAIRQILEFMR